MSTPAPGQAVKTTRVIDGEETFTVVSVEGDTAVMRTIDGWTHRCPVDALVHAYVRCSRARCGEAFTAAEVAQPTEVANVIVTTPEGPRYHRDCWDDLLDGAGYP